MFGALSDQFRSSVEEIKTVVIWQDEIRDSIHSPIASRPGNLTGPHLTEILQQGAPSRIAWQTFDHCASISRFYALFEDAIFELVNMYLQLLPAVTPTYTDLDLNLRTQHRIGVGTILTKWALEGNRYSSIKEDQIAAGLSNGLSGNAFSILPEAFFINPENFRTSALCRLFGCLGFDKALSYLRSHNGVAHFMRNTLSGVETVDSYLDAFVTIRNESSHGKVTNLSSAKQILEYGDFLITLIDAISSLFQSDIIKSGVKTGRTHVIGKMVHAFSHNIAGVSAKSDLTLSVGDRIFGGKRSIEPATVLSIKIREVAHESLLLSPGLEFGVGLDIPLPAGANLYYWTSV